MALTVLTIKTSKVSNYACARCGMHTGFLTASQAEKWESAHKCPKAEAVVEEPKTETPPAPPAPPAAPEPDPVTDPEPDADADADVPDLMDDDDTDDAVEETLSREELEAMTKRVLMEKYAPDWDGNKKDLVSFLLGEVEDED